MRQRLELGSGLFRRIPAAWLLATFAAAAPLLASGEAVPLNPFHLPPGATLTLTFDVDIDSPLGVCATAISNQGTVTANNHANVPTDDPDVVGSANPTVTGLDAIDLAITKTDGAASEIPGTPITYTIVASNAGPAPAIGVTVSDDFPSTLQACTTNSVAAGGATGNDTGMVGDFVDSGINLPSGAMVTYTTTCTIDPAATGTLANTATIAQSGTQIECNTTNNSATDTDTLTPQADVAITKTNGVASIDAGTTTTYTIVASNGASGPSTAAGVAVVDNFDFTKFSGCSTTSVAAGGATGNDSGPFAGNINDTGITLPAGATVTYTAMCTLLGSATGTLSNTATISTTASDPNGANNSATDGPDTINPLADLSITKTDGTTTAVPGMTVTYTIVASNAGPATATGASVSDTFAATLTCNWTCVGGGGGTCTAGPVAGNIADSVTLPAGGSATYTAVCQLADNATGSLVNTATISGGGVTDNNQGNNTATDTDQILPLDFGDAPDSTLGPPWAYPTLLAADGARHGVNVGDPLRMGALIDTEADGQPTLTADGDDLAGVDDEDGVTLPGFFVACESSSISVTKNGSVAGRLDAFVDWNRNGSFADAGEKILHDVVLVAGVNIVSAGVPCSAAVGSTFARFRISSAGALTSLDVAADGEVEDYPVTVRGLDFGDAPDPLYPTLFASNGARHVQGGGGPILGALVDTEPNGQPSAGANGDDLAGVDDEDGVTFTSPIFPGQNATVTVTASAVGVLNAWIDFDADGSWAQAGDQIFTNTALAAGPNLLTFAAPLTANSNTATVSRFRIATAGGLSFTGLGADGDVEDHAVTTAPVADLSITKTDGGATEVPGTSVTYTITASNPGPDPITGATVTDTFPGILSGVTWTCVGAGSGTCTAGPVAGNINDTVNLPVGGSATYTATGTISAAATGTLVNTATVTLPAGTFDPDTNNNSATDTDTLTPEADLAITKTDGVATEVPGTSVTYTITATNAAGPSNVSATVADTFPATITGVTWTCVGAIGGTCTAAGSGNINDPVNLPVGASVTYTATGTISPAATGTLVNTATVAATGGATDPNPGNNSATDTDTLTPEADLAITKTDGSATEVPGTTVTYTIVASNPGPSNAVGATVADTFPGTITGVTWTCVGAGGGSCTAAGSGNINDVVNIPAGGSVTYTATGTIASSATGTLVNTATVTAAGGTTDPNPGNNSATDTDTLNPSADLEITKDDSADPPPAGQDLIYTLTVENLGPSDALNVDVSDPLPAEVTYISDDCGGTNGSPWVWNVGTLASGATVTCNITVSINLAPPPSILNTASVEASTADPDTDNNSDTESTDLDAVPPTVTNVDSLAGTGDGTLAECETASAPISSLKVTFDESMFDPAGDSDPGDVTNPASYLVVAPGADFDFSTTGCGGTGGDDEALALAGVTYDDLTTTATLALGGPIAASQYRLFACDTLTDLAGNPLDGDADSNPGGDFARAFRADPGNRFANGHFDCDLGGWTVAAATSGEVFWDDIEDADGANDSGSAHFTNLAPGIDTTFALGQCYPVPGAPQFQVRARVRLAADPGDFIGFTRSCEFFSGPSCAGSLGTQSSSLLLSDTGGGWLSLAQTISAPAGRASARCAFTFTTQTGEAFDGFVDATGFFAGGLIFSDGFESGDTSAWSLTVP